jgi:hypothetical protein
MKRKPDGRSARRDTVSRRTGVLASFAFLSVLLLAVVTGVLADAQEGQPATPLPTLPPVSVLEPGLFDANGCQRVPPPDPLPPSAPWTVECGLSMGADVEEPEGASAWRNLLGFVGPYYATELRAGEVVLLQESVIVSTQGTWEAWGLVRNETTQPAGAVVSASLFATDGTLLATPSAAVQVDPLRPGEPGPFAISSDIGASRVARIDWSVQSAVSGSNSPRDFLILQHWTLPYGDRPPFELVYSDPDGPPPYPFVLAGDVENLRSAEVGRPTVVVAWVDENMRVRWVTSTQSGEVPFNPSRAASFPSTLESRVTAPYFIVVDDPEVGPLLTNLAPMLWAVAS